MTALAEIATQEAAEAFAAYASRFPDFDSLFLRIEATGFPLGVEGRLRCFVVLSRLASLGVKLTDSSHLAEYILPVLAASTHEQQSIRRVIEDWARPGGAEVAETVRATAAREAAAPREATELERADRTGIILATGLLSLALAGVATLIVTRVLNGSAPDTATAAASIVRYSQPLISLDVGLDPFWRRVIEDALSRLGFAVGVLVVGLSFAAWRSELKGRLVRQSGATDLVEPFQFTAEIPNWFRGADARAAFDRLKRVRLFDTDLIDVPETIEKSARSGGLPLVANKRQRELPNYVLLIDRAGREDLAGIFARAVEAALIDARIVYSRYDFSGGLNRLNPVRGGAQTDIVDAEYLPFSVIASRHAGERLILIGAGTGFFEVPGFRYARSGRRTLVRAGTPLPETIHIREFGAAFLITPAPVSAWGENERRLNELGFEIFSADVDGIQNIAAQLMSEPGALVWTSAPSETDEDQFLIRLDRDATRLSAAIPPASAEIERLVRNLKIWTGNGEVYTVLAAIAAFPKIDSAFTFVLARMVLGKEMDSALFARLVRLPWIRNGYMPDWLRIAIVNGLDPEQRKSVQAIQMTMLAGTEKAQEEGKQSSPDQLVAAFQVARELPRGKLEALISRIQARTILPSDERIFFSVLRDYRLNPEIDVIRPEAPEIVAEMIDAPERIRRAQIRAAVIGLAAIAAVLQPWIWMLLTTVGQATDLALRATGAIFGTTFFATTSFRPVATVCLLLAMTLWFVNVMRHEPIVFERFWLWWRPLPLRWGGLSRRLLDPRVPALYAVLSALLALIALLNPRTAPGTADLSLLTGVILLTAGGAVLAWVSTVTPELWWNAEHADDKLQMQVQRDPVTGTLGSTLVVAIWAVPWFLDVLPGTIKDIAPGMLFFVACIGAVSWVASIALARRWLIGEASTGPLYRLWMDAGFALIVFLLFTCVIRTLGLLVPLSSGGPSLGLLVPIWIAAPAVYTVHLKATLGVHNTRPVWGPLINGAVMGFTTTLAGVFGIAALTHSGNDYLILLPPALVGGLSCGAVTAFQFRRSDYYGSTATALRAKCVVLGGVLFVAGLGFGFALDKTRMESMAQLFSITVRSGANDFYATLTVFVLPAALAVWPMFRVLAPTFRIVEPAPLWRKIAGSPWWGTLAMWLAGIVWHIGGITFSIWPLALPIAIVFWWHYGKRALVPVAVGTLPLLVRLGNGETTLYTPGGLWPAIAIFFVARFAADNTFRQRWLRREHLSWPEAFLIVALLTVNLDVSLGPAIAPGISALAHVDPSWMLVTAAFVIGASRMPASRFAVAVIAAWLVLYIPDILNGHRPSPAISLGSLPGDVATLLLVLYGTRAWRTYAAGGVGSPFIDGITGLADRRLARMKMHGLLLSYSAALTVAILASGLVPAVDLPGVNPESGRIVWTFVPSIPATLALVLLTGLIAGNLWNDRFLLSKGPIDPWFRFFFQFIRFAYAPLGVLLSYIALAWVGGATALASFGIGATKAENFPRDIGAIGFTVCAIAYFTFGIGTRIVGERRDGESWRAATRRLWTASEQQQSMSPNPQADPPPSSEPDPPPRTRPKRKKASRLDPSPGRTPAA
jgi:hypothetical protein